MLKALKDRGIHLAVLSNKPDRQTVKVVKEIFGDNIFDYAQGQKDGIRRKPEPDGVWYLMEQMQYRKKNVCISEIRKSMRQPERMQP